MLVGGDFPDGDAHAAHENQGGMAPEEPAIEVREGPFNGQEGGLGQALRGVQGGLPGQGGYLLRRPAAGAAEGDNGGQRLASRNSVVKVGW